MKLCKKYGLFTAIAMVAGTVIGSGVFFKAEAVLRITAGNVFSGLLSWIAGGLCMMATLMSFAVVFAGTDGAEELSGIATETVGESYSYYLRWFMNSIYFPSLAAVLAFLSARYTLQTFGAENLYGAAAFFLATFFLSLSFAENTFFPQMSGNVQKITTVIKLLPLFLMIVLGTGKGIFTGILEMNMSIAPKGASLKTFLASVSAVLFAYEGWIGTFCIGPELENSKRNLPLALIFGGMLVLFVYVFYYMGIMGAVPSGTLLNYGSDGIRIAFSSVVGELFSKLLFLFVSVSCIGALNGMTFALKRSLKNSLKGFGISFFWLIFLFKTGDTVFGFDISEIPVVTLYALYIPIFVAFLRKYGKSISALKRITVVCGIIASTFTAVCALYAHFPDMPYYAMVLTGIMLLGAAKKRM